MNQHRQYYTIICVMLALLLPAIARAQFLEPLTSGDGFGRAWSIARDSIGDDAQIIFLNSAGGSISSIKAEYEVEEGRSVYWLYTFFSPTAEKIMEIGVTRPVGLGFFGQGRAIEYPDVVRPVDTARLDLGGSYSTSDKLYARLVTDPDFTLYRSRYPDANPNLVSLGNLDIDSLPITVEFDKNQPVWTMLWGGGGDSAFLCIVGARTGDVQCGLLNVGAAVPPAPEGAATAALTVAPNPANGRTRVTIDLPEGAHLRDGAEIILYNERGERALDITGSCAANGYRWGEFDAGRLPAGIYFVRAAGSNWSGLIGVVVE